MRPSTIPAVNVSEHLVAEDLQEVLNRPDIWLPTWHDGVPRESPSEYAEWILAMPRVVCLRVSVDGELGGFFLAVPIEGVFEAHTLMLPNCRGRRAIEAGRLAICWFFNHRDVEFVRSFYREDHPEVLLFARLCGFSVIGSISPDVLVDGKPLKTRILQLSRSDFTY